MALATGCTIGLKNRATVESLMGRCIAEILDGGEGPPESFVAAGVRYAVKVVEPSEDPTADMTGVIAAAISDALALKMAAIVVLRPSATPYRLDASALDPGGLTGANTLSILEIAKGDPVNRFVLSGYGATIWAPAMRIQRIKVTRPRVTIQGLRLRAPEPQMTRWAERLNRYIYRGDVSGMVRENINGTVTVREALKDNVTKWPGSEGLDLGLGSSGWIELSMPTPYLEEDPATHGVMDDLVVQDVFSTGGRGLLRLYASRNVYIARNRVYQSDSDGLRVIGYPKDVTIEENAVIDAGDDAISVGSHDKGVKQPEVPNSRPPENVLAQRNVVRGNRVRGMTVFGGTMITYRDNVISDTYYAGIYVNSPEMHTKFDCEDVQLIGNELRRCGLYRTPFGQAQHSHPTLDGSHAANGFIVVRSGNTGTYGVDFGRVTNMRIEGNRIATNGETYENSVVRAINQPGIIVNANEVIQSVL